MSYCSNVRESNEPVIIQLPKSARSAEEQAFYEEAKRRGFTAPDEQDNPLSEIENLLNDCDLGYFLLCRLSGGALVLISSRESGKAYDFEDSVKMFARAIVSRGGTITGTLFLEGEDVGDVQRIRFAGDHVIIDKATLTFPDGKTYPE